MAELRNVDSKLTLCRATQAAGRIEDKSLFHAGGSVVVGAACKLCTMRIDSDPLNRKPLQIKMLVNVSAPLQVSPRVAKQPLLRDTVHFIWHAANNPSAPGMQPDNLL